VAPILPRPGAEPYEVRTLLRAGNRHRLAHWACACTALWQTLKCLEETAQLLRTCGQLHRCDTPAARAPLTCPAVTCPCFPMGRLRKLLSDQEKLAALLSEQQQGTAQQGAHFSSVHPAPAPAHCLIAALLLRGGGHHHPGRLPKHLRPHGTEGFLAPSGTVPWVLRGLVSTMGPGCC
jgi:hypothetical protein